MKAIQEILFPGQEPASFAPRQPGYSSTMALIDYEVEARRFVAVGLAFQYLADAGLRAIPSPSGAADAFAGLSQATVEAILTGANTAAGYCIEGLTGPDTEAEQRAAIRFIHGLADALQFRDSLSAISAKYVMALEEVTSARQAVQVAEANKVRIDQQLRSLENDSTDLARERGSLENEINRLQLELRSAEGRVNEMDNTIRELEASLRAIDDKFKNDCPQFRE